MSDRKFRPRWRADATGPVARFAGEWAGSAWVDRELLAEMIRATPNGNQIEVVEVCGAWRCVLPVGHNVGRADVPANHEPKEPVEMRHCDGCGEDYNAFEESHVGHELDRVADA